MTTTTTQPGTTEPGTTDNRAPGKSTRTDEVLERLATGITDLTTSQNWAAWLRVQARFTNYSFGNSLLIALQAPDATRVAGYRAWVDLGRKVRTGEKAIWILAPMTRRRPGENPDRTGQPAGVETDTPRAAGREVFGFKAVPVFDLAQTEGPDLPELSRRLSGTAPGRSLYELTRVATGLGYRVEYTQLGGGRNGECHFLDRAIRVEERNDPAQQVKTLCHELGHALLHDPTAPDARIVERDLAECEAESVAYVVCAALGVDSGDYSFGYLAAWAGGGPEAMTTIRTSGQRIQRTATHILTALQVPEE
jgi:hypothetical protein